MKHLRTAGGVAWLLWLHYLSDCVVSVISFSIVSDRCQNRFPPLTTSSKLPVPSSITGLCSTSAPEKTVASIDDDNEEHDEDWQSEYEQDDSVETDDDQSGHAAGIAHYKDEGEDLIATVDTTPIGCLTVEQIDFVRGLMEFLVHEDEILTDSLERKTSQDPSSSENAHMVNRLFFRLMDEWNAAIDTMGDEEGGDDIVAILEPTLDDFTLILTAWKQVAYRYRSARRPPPAAQEAVNQVGQIWQVLQELWQDAGIDALQPTPEIVETVLAVLASSRERGMDRRVWSIFEAIRDGQIFGFGPTSRMYQSVVLSLARSKDRGSPQRAEQILKEAVEAFPPYLDVATGLPGGIPRDSFNKVLISWAKSGLDYGPERAQKLIEFMDDLDRSLPDESQGLVNPNLSSFTTLIDSYAQQNDWDGVSCSERTFNRVLEHYLEGEFDEEPNVATWSIVMSAWSRMAKKHFRGAEEKAANLLKRMESLHEEGRISFSPDAIAYTTCMNAWAFSKSEFGPTNAELILDEMHEKYMDGDDSMKPSARSIQIVIDSWVKLGGEDAMEQAELMLDRYEDHLDALEQEAPAVLEDIAHIYRSMLLGWCKSDSPERAQEYLLDMLDRNLTLDSFSFDKILEAETQRLPDDGNAMKRIYQLFELLETCRKEGKVKPNERVYTTFIRSMTKASVRQLAKKANAILQLMTTLYEKGNKGIRPTMYTYNAVLNACAESRHDGSSDLTEAFKIALQVFNDMRKNGSKRYGEGLDHVSFGNLLKCANLLPEGSQKEKFIVSTFKLCCTMGYVNIFVLRDLQGSAAEGMWRSMLRCPHGEPDIDLLPSEWSSASSSSSKKNNAFGNKKKKRDLYPR